MFFYKEESFCDTIFKHSFISNMAAEIQDGRRQPQDMNFDIVHLSISHTELKFFSDFVSVEYLELLNIILLFLF